jgi:hypothetical protein
MLLLDKSTIDIWKLLLPKKNILFSGTWEYEELIFFYRNYVYFVHEDGATIRMRKPEHVHRLSQEDLWESLFHEQDTFDYDDHGMFSIGSVLLSMGFILPITRFRRGKSTYQVEVINRIDQLEVKNYVLTDVPFRYALYHALITCHEWNETKGSGREYEVQQIDPCNDWIEDSQIPF